MKTVLISIPTDKYIEPETFKSIYDLIIPEGYTIEFKYIIGDQIDQIRNLIADWGKNFDYLFSVDSDISFHPNTLQKLLQADKDIISGLYIQRILGTHNLELYKDRKVVEYEDIKNSGIIEIDSCGFGCVLIKGDVLRKMPHPHFKYISALDHKDTFSEDTFFCSKAKDNGFKVFADTSILCGHYGSIEYKVGE